MARTGTLPGTDDDESPVICHVDMDCFYAACERLREPKLEGEPVVIGMGYEADEPHGAVATASYEAREFGVESAQTISRALERLPRRGAATKTDTIERAETGYYRPVDMEFYEEVASDVRAILSESADVLRAVSIDEAYLDVSSTVEWRNDEPRSFAADLKERIETNVGVTPSIGVAPAMSAAKVASDLDKPDGLVVVEPGSVREFFAPLDVDRVHGVGPVTAAQLHELGIETAGDLADSDRETITDLLGERGRAIRAYARGEDDRAVEPVGEPKSLSRESAFTEATADRDRQRERVEALATAVADRARRRDALYRTIGIKVVEPPYDVNTRARSLPGPVEDASLVREVAHELFEEFAGTAVRKLGVRVSNLSLTDEAQPTLDKWDGAEPVDDTKESPIGQATLRDFS